MCICVTDEIDVHWWCALLVYLLIRYLPFCLLMLRLDLVFAGLDLGGCCTYMLWMSCLGSCWSLNFLLFDIHLLYSESFLISWFQGLVWFWLHFHNVTIRLIFCTFSSHVDRASVTWVWCTTNVSFYLNHTGPFQFSVCKNGEIEDNCLCRFVLIFCEQIRKDTWTIILCWLCYIFSRLMNSLHFSIVVNASQFLCGS